MTNTTVGYKTGFVIKLIIGPMTLASKSLREAVVKYSSQTLTD